MPKKLLLLLIVTSLVALVIVLLGRFQDGSGLTTGTDQMQSQVQQNPPPSNDGFGQQIKSASTLDIAQPTIANRLTEATLQTDASTHSAAQQDKCAFESEDIPPELEDELVSYFNQLLGWDFSLRQYNEYLDYDEPTLTVLAESGDPRAMLTLGINYRWYAQFTNFESPLIRKDPVVSNPQKRQQLDIHLLDKSLYWLEQASYHGIPTALSEQKIGYELMIEAGQPHVSIPDLETLAIHSAAIDRFIERVLPDYRLISFNIGNLNSLQPDQQQAAEQKLELLDANWQHKRELLGLPQTIELAKSPQLLTVLSNLQQCMQQQP